jgi:hypothetical protein
LHHGLFSNGYTTGVTFVVHNCRHFIDRILLLLIRYVLVVMLIFMSASILFSPIMRHVIVTMGGGKELEDVRSQNTAILIITPHVWRHIYSYCQPQSSKYRILRLRFCFFCPHHPDYKSHPYDVVLRVDREPCSV